jgi:hypothetical protein
LRRRRSRESPARSAAPTSNGRPRSAGGSGRDRIPPRCEALDPPTRRSRTPVDEPHRASRVEGCRTRARPTRSREPKRTRNPYPCAFCV